MITAVMLAIICAPPATAQSGDGPISRYCDSISKHIQSKWKPPADVEDSVTVSFTVDEQGTVKDVETPKKGPGSAKSQDILKQQIIGLGKVPVPTNGASMKLVASICKTHGNVEVSDDRVDMMMYMADLQRRIKRAWFPPRGKESKHIVMIFNVGADGTMTDLRADKYSDDAAADKAALDAVRNASPFRQLPDGAPPHIDISFTFDYNMLSRGAPGSGSTPGSGGNP
jgi:TonB family protein